MRKWAKFAILGFLGSSWAHPEAAPRLSFANP
jgi:hypothetical protein